MTKTEEGGGVDRALSSHLLDRSFLRRTEELLCGQVFWRVMAHRQDRKLSALLRDGTISVDSADFRKLDDKTDRYHERSDYGRILSDRSRPLVDYLYGEGFSRTEIRDAVFGRLLWDDGTVDFDWMRKHFLLVSACCWHLIAAVVSVLLMVMTFSLPGSLILKSIVGLGIAVGGLYSSVFMHSLAIRPIWIWEKTRVALERFLCDGSLR